jgi:hypothetical protein
MAENGEETPHQVGPDIEFRRAFRSIHNDLDAIAGVVSGHIRQAKQEFGVVGLVTLRRRERGTQRRRCLPQPDVDRPFTVRRNRLRKLGK